MDLPGGGNMSSIPVVVVEDDPDQLYMAPKRLRSLGFEPIPAANGVEALKVLSTRADVRHVVTDYSMPVLGGEAWIRVLERFCADCTIVVVSGEDIDPGPFVSIPKPPDFANIATYLRS